MTKLFSEDGISFRYPSNWMLEREDGEGGWTVSVQSPDTAFLVLSCDRSMPDAEEVAETTLEALQEEYPGLEAEPSVENLAGRMAVGHDIQFMSFDLTNTCWTRCFDTESGTVLVMCQANDLELETSGPTLKAICASLAVDDSSASVDGE
jgi:hypothetical protein